MDKPYCFGNYSDCACNECPAVEGCIKQLDINNAEYEKKKNKRRNNEFGRDDT